MNTSLKTLRKNIMYYVYVYVSDKHISIHIQTHSHNDVFAHYYKLFDRPTPAL